MDNKTRFTNISELHQEGWTITKGWPDLLYFHLTEDGLPEAVFVTNRSNSRQFTMEKAATLRVMEMLGLQVRINSNGSLMTLDQFETGGNGSLSIYGRQTIANYRVDLKLMKFEINQLLPEDPRYFILQAKIAAKEKIIGAHETQREAFLVKPVEEVRSATGPSNPMVAYSDRLTHYLRRMRAKGKQDEGLNQVNKI